MSQATPMPEETCIQIFHEVEQRPFLWNASLDDYSNHVKREAAFEQIGTVVNLPGEVISKKWEELTEITEEPSWPLYPYMKFLEPIIRPRKISRGSPTEKLGKLFVHHIENLLIQT